MISLIGLPGSGKSTIGKHLARQLAFSFVDSDQVIEEHLGCSIREYFEREGESAFRDVEQHVIAALLQGKRMDGVACWEASKMVLSTGGGSVLRQANRENLKRFSKVVYLRALPEELFRRLKNDKTRPLLQVDDPLKKLRELFALRDPLYRECAEFQLDTGRPSVPNLVQQIMSHFELPKSVEVSGA